MTVTRRFGVFGLSLEDVASRLSDRLTDENPRLSLSADRHEVTVLLTAETDPAVPSSVALDDTAAFVRDRLGVYVYGTDTPDLQHRVVSLLLQKNKKIATAESCTAGLLSSMLTEVSGVSAVFECGVAAYSNEIKHSVLGVPSHLLETYGAVSEQVAGAMAIGVRRLSGADFGIGITGVAGPEPSEGKPVGTVFVALADEKRMWVKKIELKNADREQVRLFAAMTALDLARRHLEASPGVMAGALPLEPPSSETLPFPTGRVKKLRFWSPLFPSKSQGRAALFRAGGLWLLIALLLCGIACYFYYFVYLPLHNEQIYERLETVYDAGFSDTSAVVDTSMYPDGMLSRFYALYDQNADIRGWLKVDGTSIAYPVMDCRHSAYYASHDFLRAPSDYGVPYFSSAADFSSATAAAQSRTLAVLGNRGDDGQMLSPLLRYTDSAFFRAHEYLSLNTLYSEDRYRVVAVCYADIDGQTAAFPYTAPPAEKDAYAAFLEELKARSLYALPFSLTDKSHLLFLSVDSPTEASPSRRLLVVCERLQPFASEPAFAITEKAAVSEPLNKADLSRTTSPAAGGAQTTAPASRPAAQPTAKPTQKHKTQPTVKPTTRPTVRPTAPPTAEPATQPTTTPTDTPSSTEPTTEATAFITTAPSVETVL